MAKAKFKVGDKVKILDGSKIENYTGGWSSFGMQDDVGKIVTIKEVCDFSDGRIGYRMNEIICVWDERGLELIEAKDKETIVIYRDGNEVIALNKKTKEKAVAKCNPSDESDFKIGAGLAFDRLMHKFKVGDWVIGNDKAGDAYAITTKGWVGRIVYVGEDGTIRARTEKDSTAYHLDSDCFDFYVKPEKSEKPEPKKYTASIVCIQKGFGFTAGKIYEVKDGVLVDDDGNKRLSGDIESLAWLNKYICGGSEFIELVK